jgi:hypothetical protein
MGGGFESRCVGRVYGADGAVPSHGTSLSCLANMLTCGPGSSVGIATDYGLEGPGPNLGEDEIFRPSRQALGPTQPPVKWVPGLYRG